MGRTEPVPGECGGGGGWNCVPGTPSHSRAPTSRPLCTAKSMRGLRGGGALNRECHRVGGRPPGRLGASPLTHFIGTEQEQPL